MRNICATIAIPFKEKRPDVLAPHTRPVNVIWPSRALQGTGFLCFLALRTEGGVANWSGVYMATAIGVSTAVTASAYAVFSVTMIAGRLSGGWSAHRRGELSVLSFGGMAVTLGFVAVRVPVTAGSAIVGFALVGIGASNVVPILFSAAARSEAVVPGVAIAMAATMGYAGFLLGPPMIGFADDYFGLRLALCVLLMAFIIISAFGRIVLRNISSETE